MLAEAAAGTDAELAAALRAAGVGPGEPIALVGENGPRWPAAYWTLLAAGATPLLADAAAPDAEVRRLLETAGGTRTLRVGDETLLTGEPPSPEPSARTSSSARVPSSPRGLAPADGGGNVLIPTSGSTGAPKLVSRSRASLDAEGRRHARWAALTPADVIALPLPLWHAYALGWAHAAAVAGAALHPAPPAALGRCAELINAGATVLPLVPATARLLAARAPRSVAPGHRLRLIMVGAGPVTDELDRRFTEVLGLGLARNYGSTETGALFSGAPGVPAGVVGWPLEGVEYRIDQGELHVRVDGGGWRAMGDLVEEGPDGVRVLGRRTRAVRRGDRWVAPDEVEQVLRRHGSVVEARVSAGPAGTLVADVVTTRAAAGSAGALRDHAAAELAPSKVPDRVLPVGDIARTAVGKPAAARPLTPDTGALAEAAQAYKRSELLFALDRLGLLERLARSPATPEAAAAELGLDRGACQELLAAAEAAGLLRPAGTGTAPDVHDLPGAPGDSSDPGRSSGSGDPASAGPDESAPGGLDESVAALIALEERLARTWVTRDALADVARNGIAGRRFDRTPPDPEAAAAYRNAMHSPAAWRRSRLGLGLARLRPGHRLLEITSGPGRYARSARDAPTTLLRVGALAGADAAPEPPGGEYDLVVVCNAVHLPGPGSDLEALAGLLAPGGTLLIDDVFLDAPGGPTPAIRLDWLTHGGCWWPTEAGLAAGLARAGLAPGRTVHAGSPAATLALAHAGPRAAARTAAPAAARTAARTEEEEMPS
ncbi:AMP-binding protein [Actinomadura viridis]|uniref:AMP-binding protein n=1 Tax=Actinomadura viridis TaxID=58110 RepID=UPI00369A97B7